MEPSSLSIEHDVEIVLSRSYPFKESETAVEQTETGGVPDLLQWLAKPPMFTTLRVNTTATSTQSALQLLETELKQQCRDRGMENFTVWCHPSLSDCLVIQNAGPHLPTEQADVEVLVDVACGMAILRGADIYKSGILGAPTAMLEGSRVGVVCDVEAKCLRGRTQAFQGKKLYVGTGVALVSREEVFRAEQSSLRGVGIQMTDPLYRAPSLSGVLPDKVFAQNLPSIVCGHVLNPSPGQVVLDMCASPGGKTCHLAALMKDTGRVVALDKTADKVSKVTSSAENLGLTCIEGYAFDSRKAVQQNADISGGPPYPPGCFDAVLLDGPCSALGQRPAIRNKVTANALASFPKLQRKLLSAAVSLVKPGGVLVYSTCTVTLEENEDQVAWLLRTLPDDVTLEQQSPHLGGFGLVQSSLSEDERRLVQRFDPSSLANNCREHNCDSDTIGFFIAKFRKKAE